MTAPHADRDHSEGPAGEATLVEAFGRTAPVAVLAWELEDGDTGRPFWPGHVDGAATMQETGEHPAGDDAAGVTVHDLAGHANSRTVPCLTCDEPGAILRERLAVAEGQVARVQAFADAMARLGAKTVPIDGLRRQLRSPITVEISPTAPGAD